MPSLASLPLDELRVLSRLRSTDHTFVRAPPPARAAWPRRLAAFLASFMLPGMGMFSESYFIFSLGTITPLLAVYYPACFGSAAPADCDTAAVDWLGKAEIIFIIAGMLAFAVLADRVGRKVGSRATMAVMTVGSVLLASAAGPASAFLTVYFCGLAVFAFGVGGEYPLSAASAVEKADADPATRPRRGRAVVLMFSQQGLGSFVNSLVLVLLLAVQGATGAVSPTQATITWHAMFAIGAAIVFAVSVYRALFLEESEVWQAERAAGEAEREAEAADESVRSAAGGAAGGGADGGAKVVLAAAKPKGHAGVLTRRYGLRLIATAGGW